MTGCTSEDFSQNRKFRFGYQIFSPHSLKVMSRLQFVLQSSHHSHDYCHKYW